MEELQFKLDSFEGPLDLLLKLISKNKINIYDIPIALLLDQYIEQLREMQESNMDIASEFIVMASELMLIKSRMLLPKNEEDEEEDPRMRLAAALLEYKRIKEAILFLQENYTRFSGRMVKETSELEPDNELPPQDIVRLKEALIRLLNEVGETDDIHEKNPHNAIPFTQGKQIPVSDKVFDIMSALFHKKKMSFHEIVTSCSSRSEVIASFLAILELLKIKRILIDPEKNTSEDLSFTANLEFQSQNSEETASYTSPELSYN